MNKYLRGSIAKHELSDSARNALKTQTRVLNELIRNAPVSPSPCVLFRATSAGSVQGKSYLPNDRAEFLNSGIISTSKSYKGASDFLEEKEKCCLLVILLPKGMPMLQVLENSVWPDEEEVLLPHGCKFRVVKTVEIHGITHMYCRVTSGEERSMKVALRAGAAANARNDVG